MADEITIDTILRTKLHRPPVPGDYVHRPRLVEYLDQRRERPLTLVSAPAGYGKSVLISCWLETCDIPNAWLSLDEHDADLRRFLLYFLAAIQTMFSDAVNETMTLANASPLPPMSVLVRSLANELDSIERNFILMLDDIHRIHEKLVHDFLAELLQYPPRPMYLVLAGRSDPSLPITSYRAKNQVSEVRLFDLRFTSDETAAYLQTVLGEQIKEDIVAILAERADGWITGLRLAVLAMRKHDNVVSKLLELKGTTVHVTEYLINEVMDAQPSAVRHCLLSTCILNRFSAPLCDALWAPDSERGEGVIDGAAFIAKLQKNNLFLIALDAENTWFRYHHLFQELLRRQLKHQSGSKEIVALHSCASEWFEGQGLIEEAIEQGFAAGDLLRAARLVEQNRLRLLDDEKWYVLMRWLSRLPDRIKRERPELLLAQAWVFFFHLKLEAIPAILDQVESLLNNGASERPLYGEVDYFRGYMLVWQNEGAQSLKHLEDALERIPVTHSLIRGEAELMFGLAAQMAGEKERAVQELNDLLLSHPSPQAARKWRLFVGLSYMHLVSGDLDIAFTTIREQLDIAINTNNGYALAHISYLLGLNHFYRNELDAAIRYLSQAAEQKYILISVIAVDAMAALTYAYQVLHMPDEAHATLALLLEYVGHLDEPVYSTIAQSCKAHLSIMQGKPESAYRLIETIEPPPPGVMVFWVEIPAVTHCRVLLAEGSSASLGEAEKRLQEYLQVSQATHNTCQMIGMMALLAVTYERQARHDEALSILERALILARPGGFIRPFLEPGPPMADLLKRLKKEAEDTALIDQILAAFKEDEDRVASKAADAPAAPPPAERAQPLVEPLTNRELDVLELLAQRLQNKEIAEKLFISDETVKGHLKNI